MRRFLLIAVILSLFWVMPVTTITPVFVNSTTGNDAWDCASATFTSGTHGPCRTIQRGVNAAGSTPGALIQAVGSFNETVATWFSGTASQPITLQGVSNPTWTKNNCGVLTYGCMVEIKDQNYIKITGFTFQNANGKSVVDMWNSTGQMTGIQIVGNTFINNGHRGILDGSDDMTRVIYFRGPNNHNSHLVQNNVFTSNYGACMWGLRWQNSTFDGNVGTGTKSSQTGSSNGFQFLTRLAHVGSASNGNRFTNNELSNLVKDSYVTGNTCGICTAAQAAAGQCVQGGRGVSPCKWQSSGLKGDVGASNNIYQYNYIHDINTASASNTTFEAMFAESGCNFNEFSYNRLANIGDEGIRIGSYNTNLANNNIVKGNSLYNVRYGIDVIRGAGTVIQDNIVHAGNQTDALATYSTQYSGTATWRNNDWYKPGGGQMFLWGAVQQQGVPNKTYAEWTPLSGETGGKNQDPLFNIDGTDFHLQPASPCIDAALDGTSDMGAYPNDTHLPPTPHLTLVQSPNGGELYIIGLQTQNIVYQTNFVGNVNIDLATDGGTNFQPVAASITPVLCTGSMYPPGAFCYSWTVTGSTSSFCKIRVSEAADPTVSDLSDAEFREVGPYLK